MALTVIEHKSAPTSDMFDFTGLDLSGYQALQLSLNGLVVGTDAAFINLRLSTGGTLRTSGYRWRNSSRSSGTGTEEDNSQAATSIQLMGDASDTNFGIGNAAGESASMNIMIYNADAALYKHCEFRGVGIGPSGSMILYRGAGALEQTGDIDGIRVLPSTGTLTAGKATLYGLTID